MHWHACARALDTFWMATSMETLLAVAEVTLFQEKVVLDEEAIREAVAGVPF
jgi:hypothetical protein